ncbi:hypothetical protein BH18THE2_BH18THE2_12360 [soil metagenome]
MQKNLILLTHYQKIFLSYSRIVLGSWKKPIPVKARFAALTFICSILTSHRTVRKNRASIVSVNSHTRV